MPGSFGADVARAVAEVGVTGNCAAALPPIATAANELSDAVRRQVASVLAPEPSRLDAALRLCGTPGFADCATAFQHDLFKSDGRLGAALYPLAQRVVREAGSVALTVWTPTSGPGPAVTIAGVFAGRMLGIAFFNGLQRCDFSVSQSAQAAFPAHQRRGQASTRVR